VTVISCPSFFRWKCGSLIDVINK